MGNVVTIFGSLIIGMCERRTRQEPKSADYIYCTDYRRC